MGQGPSTNQQLKQLNEPLKTLTNDHSVEKIVVPICAHSPKVSNLKRHRGRSPQQMPQYASLPEFTAAKKRGSVQEITWFGGQAKEEMLQRQRSNETSFKTLNYEKTFSVKKPKQEHPQHSLYRTSYNIVTNNDGSEIAENNQYADPQPFRSVSVAGIKDSPRG